MNKEQFLNQEIKKLKKMMYGDDPDLMSEKEEQEFRKFFEEFIKDLKEVSKTSYENTDKT